MPGMLIETRARIGRGRASRIATAVAFGAALGLISAAFPIVARHAAAQASDAARPGSWLDAPLTAWNVAGQNVHKPPPPSSSLQADAQRCGENTRKPSLDVDRPLVREGWKLFGPAMVYGRTTIVKARSDADGMCRPLGYNVFVFYDGKFAGTISPVLMNARTDGAETNVHILDEDQVTVEFARYTAQDPLCCPSSTSRVMFELKNDAAGPRLVPLEAAHESAARAAASDATHPLTGSSGSGSNHPVWRVTGSIAFKSGVDLPSGVLLRVSLQNLSHPNDPAWTIAERAIACCDRLPIRFELEYDPLLIEDKDDYAVFATVREGAELLYSAPVPVRVITRGAPEHVDLVLEPVAK
jgi:uncharacterized lipoprotein YbaY